MLRLDEEANDRWWLRVHLVVRDGRAAVVARGDDPESGLRERGDGPGRAVDRHRGRPMQDHEGRRASVDRQRAVPRQERQRDQVHHTVDPRGTSPRYSWFVFAMNITIYFLTLFIRSSFSPLSSSGKVYILIIKRAFAAV